MNVDVQITGNDVNAISKDLYDYLQRMDKTGNTIVISLRYNDSSRILKNSDNDVSLEAITETVQDLVS